MKQKRITTVSVERSDCQKRIPFVIFGENEADRLEQTAHHRTANTYRSTLRSLNRYLATRRINGKTLTPGDITGHLTSDYQEWLRKSGCSMNTISFYMRILRAIYNKAVEAGLTCDTHPFRKVYTGIAKTKKRCISLAELRKISSLDLHDKPITQMARDIFLFLFLMRGISFIDAIFLEKGSLKKGVMTYTRHKTGQKMHVRWEKQMCRITEKYTSPSSPYIFNFIKPGKDERQQYYRLMSRVNQELKKVGELVGTRIPLTTYVARHTWATIAYNRRIPIGVISEGLGHASEKTTRIYLDSIDAITIDRANLSIINALDI